MQDTMPLFVLHLEIIMHVCGYFLHLLNVFISVHQEIHKVYQDIKETDC